jgi:hypothetical protein
MTMTAGELIPKNRSTRVKNPGPELVRRRATSDSSD